MNHFTVKFTPKAEEDMSDILTYIGKDSIENAIAFVDTLITKTTDTLSIMPYSGTVFGVIQESKIRSFVVHKAYTIFYRVVDEQQQVEVISVFNTHKDEKKFWRKLKSQGIYRFPDK